MPGRGQPGERSGDRRGLVDDQTKDEAEKPLRETSGDDDCQCEYGGEDDDVHFDPFYRQRMECL